MDGISQLYSDDFESMRVAMMSDAQRACVEDLRGFLSDVTLVIQREGPMRRIGPPANTVAKFMFLIGGEQSTLNTFADELVAQLCRLASIHNGHHAARSRT